MQNLQIGLLTAEYKISSSGAGRSMNDYLRVE